MGNMESPREEISKPPDHTEPLSEVEIDELATALRRLSTEGIAVPKHLLRHAIAGKIRTMRHYGYTHDAIPAALDRLDVDREEVVVGLIRRFEQVVREHHDQVSRERGVALDQAFWARYFDLHSTTVNPLTVCCPHFSMKEDPTSITRVGPPRRFRRCPSMWTMCWNRS